LFDLNLYLDTHKDEFKEVVDAMPFHARAVDYGRLREVLQEDGFIFA